MSISREELLDDVVNTRIDLAICLLTRDVEYPDDWDIDMAREYIIEAIHKLKLLL